MDKPKDPNAQALGSKGGSRNTTAQLQARQRNALKAAAARRKQPVTLVS